MPARYGSTPDHDERGDCPLAGIELTGDVTEEFYVGGVKTVGTLARVALTVTRDTDEFSWDAPVWFCDPWPHPFGLAGLEGFPHHFVVTINAYDGFLEVEPEPRLQDACQRTSR